MRNWRAWKGKMETGWLKYLEEEVNVFWGWMEKDGEGNILG